MITRKQAAQMLGYSVDALIRWAKQDGYNGLPVHKSPTGRVRYLLSDVEAWIAKYRRGAE